MRLAGTVNYPSLDKKGRGYVAELVTLRHVSDAPSYTIEQLTGVVPPRGPGHGESEESPALTKENFFKNVNQLALVNPSRWVRALFGNNVRFYASIGCWRTQSNKKYSLRIVSCRLARYRARNSVCACSATRRLGAVIAIELRPSWQRTMSDSS
jgi:hypothetical protein